MVENDPTAQADETVQADETLIIDGASHVNAAVEPAPVAPAVEPSPTPPAPLPVAAHEPHNKFCRCQVCESIRRGYQV